ncbi:TRI17 ligase, partial [Amazona guildingii]|nr:TRI17 ligase [Amazona guildingii]
ATLIAVARRLSLQVGRAGYRLCREHREALKLFCEEEQSPICIACRESQEHRGHSVVPIEEAAEEHKEKLQAQVQALKERREKLLGMKEAEEGKGL